MAANNKANVSVAKGVIGGYFYIAPIGTTLPTDYTTALNSAFENVGYISDEGVTHAKSSSTTDFTDMNADSIETAVNIDSRTVAATFVEMNEVALKARFGDSNVTVDSTTGAISWKDTNGEMPHVSIVEELVLKGGRRWRRVIPDAKVTEWEDTTDVSTELAGGGLTYTKYVDSTGAYEYDYLAPIE